MANKNKCRNWNNCGKIIKMGIIVEMGMFNYQYSHQVQPL